MNFILSAVLLISISLGAQEWRMTFKSPQFKEYEIADVRFIPNRDLVTGEPQVAEFPTKRVFSDGRYTITVKYLRRMQGVWQWAIKSRTDYLANGDVSKQNLTDDSKLDWVKLDPPSSKIEKERHGRAVRLFSLK